MKTQFSKEKYIRKKQQKYVVTFEVRRPTAIELCDTHHSFNPGRICHLRSDSLGFLLNMSNVHAESQVLLVEHTRGLVTGALMERGAKYIQRVEFGHDSIKINSEILEQFDHPTDPHTTVGSVHAGLLVPINKEKPDPLLKCMQQSFKRKFTSFVFVHDELHPMEVY